LLASGDIPVLDESELLGLFAWGDAAVPSLLVPGVFAESLEDGSGLLTDGVAPVVSPAIPVESPAGAPDWAPDDWPVAGEPLSGVVAVWACAATDTSAPAAKKGTSLLLMVIDASPLCEATVGGTVRIRHDPLV
jgi:hypothetical protein